MQALQILTYASIAIAILAMLAKVIRYARAPEHMRWELYPVPHEKGRADYGGSYFEEADWWTKTRHTDMLNELKEMASEILLLKGVHHHNKRIWKFSFPFHAGLYILIAWLDLLLLGAILQAAGVVVGAEASTVGAIVHHLTIVSGYAGLALVGIGALGLFLWRISDRLQRAYSQFADFFNLLLFVAVVAVVGAASLTADQQFVALRQFVQSLITFDAAGAASPSTLWAVSVGMTALLIMYIPLTRMSHFVAKYFLYHAIRWNDQPTERGTKLEKRLTELLNLKVAWSAKHMGTGKSWAEAVTETKEAEHE